MQRTNIIRISADNLRDIVISRKKLIFGVRPVDLAKTTLITIKLLNVITKLSLFTAGYFVIFIVLYLVATRDPRIPSNFGRSLLIATPIYIVLFLLISYLVNKKKKDEKPV